MKKLLNLEVRVFPLYTPRFVRFSFSFRKDVLFVLTVTLRKYVTGFISVLWLSAKLQMNSFKRIFEYQTKLEKTDLLGTGLITKWFELGTLIKNGLVYIQSRPS